LLVLFVCCCCGDSHDLDCMILQSPWSLVDGNKYGCCCCCCWWHLPFSLGQGRESEIFDSKRSRICNSVVQLQLSGRAALNRAQ
jgi:hypothetical protein